MTSVRAARAAVLALAAVAGLAAGCGGAAPVTRVLLVTLDTTRADRLGCYGYTDARTPVLDALARPEQPPGQQSRRRSGAPLRCGWSGERCRGANEPPQLSRRSFRENMYVQYGEGFRQHLHVGLSGKDGDPLAEVLGERVQRL